jgi:hypothetical protein
VEEKRKLKERITICNYKIILLKLGPAKPLKEYKKCQRFKKRKPEE